jgi:hypothetical protein
MAAIRDRLPVFRRELAALMARIGEIMAAARSGADGTDRDPEELADALADLQAAVKARDTDGMDMALAVLQKLPLTGTTYAAVADIAKHVLFGDVKKAAEAVNVLLERHGAHPDASRRIAQ